MRRATANLANINRRNDLPALGVGANIYAQRYDSAGTAVGGEFKVNPDTSQIWQQTPSVADLADGGFVIVWGDEEGAADSFLNSVFDVFAQRFDADGVAISTPVMINTFTERIA